MPDNKVNDPAPLLRQPAHRLRHLFQGIGVAAIAFLLWSGMKGDINLWAACAVALLIGALLVTSVLAELGSNKRIRLEQEAAIQALPLADTLLANIPDPIILIDRRMVVFEINAAAKELLPGLREGFPLSFALRNPDVLGGIDQVLRNGAPVKVQHIEKLPTERAFELQISLLHGDEQWVLLFFRDLTTAHRLERMRVDFIANISHELRTPLASVLGFIETIQGPARDDAPARDKFLGVMQDQARRMARLIDDLLSLSRIELHVHLAPQDPLDMDGVIRQILPALMPSAKESGVSLQFAPENGPFIINGDRDEMLRVVENLVENAIKYGGKGGLVEIGLRRLPAEDGIVEQVELSVRDHGDGIPPEYLPRLTERFYRTDSDQSRSKGGTGLGLAIVKHIALHHRGKLMIESEPGEGATFRVRIPARAEKRPT